MYLFFFFFHISYSRFTLVRLFSGPFSFIRSVSSWKRKVFKFYNFIHFFVVLLSTYFVLFSFRWAHIMHTYFVRRLEPIPSSIQKRSFFCNFLFSSFVFVMRFFSAPAMNTSSKKEKEIFQARGIEMMGRDGEEELSIAAYKYCIYETFLQQQHHLRIGSNVFFFSSVAFHFFRFVCFKILAFFVSHHI